MDTTDDLRYPIGRFRLEGDITEAQRQTWMDELAEAPASLRAAVQGLLPQQLETPYRPGGWTVRQIVHHVPDSHLNSYVRCRLALTEDSPVIKPYNEGRWAELADARSAPLEPSLALLESLHAALDAVVTLPRSRGLGSHVPAPGAWCYDHRAESCAICLARPPPYRAHHVTSPANGLVSGTGFPV